MPTLHDLREGDPEPLHFSRLVEHGRAIAFSDDIVLTITPADSGHSRIDLTVGGDCGRKLRISRIGKTLRRDRPGKPPIRED